MHFRLTLARVERCLLRAAAADVYCKPLDPFCIVVAVAVFSVLQILVFLKSLADLGGDLIALI